MSDGPFRSLPLGKYWQEAARCAGLSAFSDDDVQSKLKIALLKEAKRDHVEEVVADIRIALGAGQQLELLEDTTLSKLDGVRTKHAGSTLGSLLLDCVKGQVSNGLTGEAALEAGTTQMLAERTSSGFRSMCEIYQRRGTVDDGLQMRSRTMRLSSTLNFSGTTQKILTEGSKMKIASQARRSGLDEGPPL